MNAKENALRIIHFDKPEQVTGGPPLYRLTYYGCDHQDFEGGGHDCPVGTKWTDIWGTGWHKEMDGVMGFPRVNPLPDVESLKSYQWPDPDDERICEQIYQMAESFPDGDIFLTGSHRDTLWEKAYMLVGMENVMAYFHTEPEFVREILHKIIDFQLGIARHYIAVGVEYVCLGDDLGMQDRPLLSPRIVEEFLMPEYERLFRFYREKNIIIDFHSCGHIEWMLDNFIKLGVNVLNPVQATANNLDTVRSKTNGKIALLGAVSTQTVMDGPVEKIEAEVRDRIKQLGTNGGYFCSPDQGLPFPPAHIEALAKAIERYGRYLGYREQGTGYRKDLTPRYTSLSLVDDTPLSDSERGRG